MITSKDTIKALDISDKTLSKLRKKKKEFYHTDKNIYDKCMANILNNKRVKDFP